MKAKPRSAIRMALLTLMASIALSFNHAPAVPPIEEWLELGTSEYTLRICYDLSAKNGYQCPGPTGRTAVELYPVTR